MRLGEMQEESDGDTDWICCILVDKRVLAHMLQHGRCNVSWSASVHLLHGCWWGGALTPLPEKPVTSNLRDELIGTCMGEVMGWWQWGWAGWCVQATTLHKWWGLQILSLCLSIPWRWGCKMGCPGAMLLWLVCARDLFVAVLLSVLNRFLLLSF